MSCDSFYRVVGNVCSECCPDCMVTLGPILGPQAKCCDTSTGNVCFAFDICEECVNDPTSQNPANQKVIKYCTDPNRPNYALGKRSCCFGECYDDRCYRCNTTSKKVEPIFDSGYQGCCEGVGIYNMSNCEECVILDPNTIPVNRAILKSSCTDPAGSGYKSGNTVCCKGQSKPGVCYNEECHKCLDNNIETKCPNDSNPDPAATACCGGICWDPADQCKKCETYTVITGGVLQTKQRLVNKTPPECQKCCGKICCDTADHQCCGNECYNPRCEECT